MNKAYVFVLGGISTITLSIFIFVITPRIQVSYIEENPESTFFYTEEEERGRETYIEYGCVYCHSQQVRDPSVGADSALGWGRASIPADYKRDRPHLLGTMRTGPDLSNIGERQPSKSWHHLHLFNPRLLVGWSIMPKFPFFYTKIHSKDKPEQEAYKVPGKKNQWIIPKDKAKFLVSYMMSLRQVVKPKEDESSKDDGDKK